MCRFFNERQRYKTSRAASGKEMMSGLCHFVTFRTQVPHTPGRPNVISNRKKIRDSGGELNWQGGTTGDVTSVREG